VLSEEQRARTLERFEEHRRAWSTNEALRALYADWYGQVAAALPDRRLGRFVELGSGPGLARHYIPDLQLSDIVRAPWHDHEISADHLPFGDQTVGALVLFDVLHHLGDPAAFFTEADRVLADGGRAVLCEPYLSPLSYPIYRFFHEEPVRLRVDPLAVQARGDSGGDRAKDPFDSNQAIPTLLFARPTGRAAFAARFSRLCVVSVDRLAGPSYPASGGFGRRPLIPAALWRALHGVERCLPAWSFRLIGFRMLVVIERRSL
jgi:SAM-dependent methyltransferase